MIRMLIYAAENWWGRLIDRRGRIKINILWRVLGEIQNFEGEEREEVIKIQLVYILSAGEAPRWSVGAPAGQGRDWLIGLL